MRFTDDEKKRVKEILPGEVVKQNPPLFKNIEVVLEELGSKYQLVVVSSIQLEEVKQKLEKFGLTKYFKEIYAAGKGAPMDKAKTIKEIMSKMSLSPDEIVMIGDRTVDYKESIEAGLSKIVIVEYGWGYDKSVVPKQEVTVNETSDLIKAVETVK